MFTLLTLFTAAVPVSTADSRWAAPACRPYVAGQPIAEGARLEALLRRDWPLAWRRRGSLAELSLSPDELSRTVAALACIATWPGQEDAATAVALPLFASHRHGNAAFAATDAVARGTSVPGPMPAAAHVFRANMIYRVSMTYGGV